MKAMQTEPRQMPPITILAIDPGNIQSAFVLLDPTTYHPIEFGKHPNHELRSIINKLFAQYTIASAAIEMVASYGMAVGREIFETCVWIGRFSELIEMGHKITVSYLYRQDVKLHICGQVKAKDTNVRMAMIDRFAQFDLKNGKGTKSNPDVFYGFSKDIWAAGAVAILQADRWNQGIYTIN